MSNPTKQQTVRRALEALRPHYDPSTAHFATLGGAGYELDVWTALDVPRANCWLIERDQQKARRLIPRARPAHVYVGELRDFPSVFRSVHPGGALDVFHWDLCDTVEPNARELHAVFPVIAASQSRCLLVTAADQRSNRSLDEADLIDAWWSWLLGSAEAHREFRQHIEAQNDRARRRGLTEAESANAVSRELSVYLHLLLVMGDFQYEDETVTRGRSLGLAALDRTRAATARRHSIDVARSFASGREPSVTFVPDELVRFVYYSRAHTALRPGFRMRTIGMHLARLEQPIPIRDAATRIAKVVTETPLHMVVPGSKGRIKAVTVPPTTVRRRRTEEVLPMAARTPEPAAAPGAPEVVHNPFETLKAEVDAFATQLAKRLHALRIPTETMVTIARQAIAPLERLQGIETGVRLAEDATRATDRVRELLKSLDGGTGAAATPVAAKAGSDAAASAVAASAAPRELSTDDRTQLTLRLLRAKRAGPERYVVERAVVKAETGLNGRAISACLARTNGKFRRGFVRRILQPLSGEARRAQAAELEQLGFGTVKQLLNLARR